MKKGMYVALVVNIAAIAANWYGSLHWDVGCLSLALANAATFGGLVAAIFIGD